MRRLRSRGGRPGELSVFVRGWRDQVALWRTPYRLLLPGVAWMALLLALLAWLDGRQGVFLVPPFAASLSILLNLSDVPIAQPTAIVAGSTLGAALGTVLAMALGASPWVAALGAVLSIAVLIALRIYHPPGIALAMYPALLHPGTWFAVAVVLPFTLVAVGSMALLSRAVPGWPRYPAPHRHR